MPRLYDRYGHTQPARTCSTPSCSGTAKGISTRCHTCVAHLRRFGHELQTLPSTAELDQVHDDASRRPVGRFKASGHRRPGGSLGPRWSDDCRARATPTYKDRNVLSYNGWEREASQLIRDISEAISFTRALDLARRYPPDQLRAPRLLQAARKHCACCTVELHAPHIAGELQGGRHEQRQRHHLALPTAERCLGTPDWPPQGS